MLAQTAVRATLTTVCAGVLVAGMILVERGGTERQRAVVAYDEDMDATCR